MPDTTRFNVRLITFAIESGGDQHFSGYRLVMITRARRSVLQVVKQAGHPEMARDVADLNGIRNPAHKLKIGDSIYVPDNLRGSAHFSVLPGDTAPQVTSGYAKIATIDRSERAGLSVFTGYDPIEALAVPVRFESEDRGDGHFWDVSGKQVEKDIRLLEQMAGRGNIAGAAVGAPPIVRVTCRSDDGTKQVPLIPSNYQWSESNTKAPLYWVSGIDWDPDPLRNGYGRRIRQLATITLTQWVRPLITTPSAATRAKQNPKIVTITTGVKTP